MKPQVRKISTTKKQFDIFGNNSDSKEGDTNPKDNEEGNSSKLKSTDVSF